MPMGNVGLISKTIVLIAGLFLSSVGVAQYKNDAMVRRYFGIPKDVPIEHLTLQKYEGMQIEDCAARECISFFAIMKTSKDMEQILEAYYENLNIQIKEKNNAAREDLLNFEDLEGDTLYGQPAEEFYQNWVEYIQKRRKIVTRHGSYTCGGYDLIAELTCQVSLEQKMLSDLSTFLDICSNNPNCVMDLNNAPKIRSSVSNEFLRLIGHLRFFKNFETEVVPSLYKQLSKFKKNQNLPTKEAFTNCFTKLDRSFHTTGIKHDMNSRCSIGPQNMKELSSTLSATGKRKLAKIRKLMKSIEKDRPFNERPGYSRQNCYVYPGSGYDCNYRARCIKDYLEDNGIKGVKYVMTKTTDTFFDTKQKMEFSRTNISTIKGTAYKFHLSPTVEIDGQLVVIDPVVGEIAGGDSFVTLDQWKRSFRAETPGATVSAALETSPHIHPGNHEFHSDRVEFKEVPGRKIQCDLTQSQIGRFQ